MSFTALRFPGWRAAADIIRHFQPRQTLMKQRQRKAELQLDHHRRLGSAHGHHIRRADLQPLRYSPDLKEALIGE